MITIQDKFKEIYPNIDINDGSTGTDLFYAFEDGYTCALEIGNEIGRESMKKQLKEAEEAIEYYKNSADNPAEAESYLEKWK